MVSCWRIVLLGMLFPLVVPDEFAVSAGHFQWPKPYTSALSISFDDGYESQLDIGLPLLAEFHTSATFYVLPFPVRERLDDWRKVVAAGHEIGNHTMGHPCTGNFSWVRADAVELENYDLDRMHSELVGSNELLERLLNVTPTSFAYPCGQTFVGRGAHVTSYVPMVHKFFRSGRRWLNETDNDPAFVDLSQVMASSMDGQPFEPVRGLIDKTTKDGRWLVLAGHRVGNRGKYSTDVTTLRRILHYSSLPKRNIWIAPVGTVAAYIGKHQTLSDTKTSTSP